VLRASLPPQFKSLAASTYTKPNYANYSAADTELILNAYAKASRAVFIFMSPVSGICLITCVFVKDRGLSRKEDEEPAVVAENGDDVKDVEKAMAASSASLPESRLEHEKDEAAKEDEIEIQKPAVAAVDPRI
jgi:hypothetical protein